MHALRCTLALFLVLLTGCGGSSAWEPVSYQDITFTNSFYRSFPPAEYTFRTQTELNAAWATSVFEFRPVPQEGGRIDAPPPVLDFATFAVVGVALPSGPFCAFPQVRAVEGQGGNLRVQYAHLDGGTSACSFGSPRMLFLLVPRFAGQVTFERVPYFAG